MPGATLIDIKQRPPVDGQDRPVGHQRGSLWNSIPSPFIWRSHRCAHQVGACERSGDAWACPL